MDEMTTRLINQCKNGNQKAFRQLYELYADYALRTAYIITHNNNHAADIVQETFIKVYQNLSKYKTSKPFKPWFYTILINESRRYMKRQNKEPFAIESEQLIDYLHAQHTIDINDYHELEYAFTQLSEIHRSVLALKYLHDFTEKEIAKMLGLNVNTVKSRLFKGRKKLRDIIGGEME